MRSYSYRTGASVVMSVLSRAGCRGRCRSEIAGQHLCRGREPAARVDRDHLPVDAGMLVELAPGPLSCLLGCTVVNTLRRMRNQPGRQGVAVQRAAMEERDLVVVD